MNRNITLALVAMAACGQVSACAAQVPLSALAGAERNGSAVYVAYSPGGGVFATGIELGQIRETNRTVVITGPCMSACTLALIDGMKFNVCWTEDASFLFHAAHVNGQLHHAQTSRNFAALPAGIRALLPDPDSWSVNRWHVVSGHEAHDALGRGYCVAGQ